MDEDSGFGLTAEDLVSVTTPKTARLERSNSFRTRYEHQGLNSRAAPLTGTLMRSQSLKTSKGVSGDDHLWSTPMRTPGSMMRKSGRFVEHDVLSALKNAPQLPSPAIKSNAMLDWSVVGGPAGDGGTSPSTSRAVGTPQVSHHFGHQPSPDGRIDRLNQSTSWLPTPARPTAAADLSPKSRAAQDWSVDTSMVSRQVLDTQQPEFISLLEKTIILPPSASIAPSKTHAETLVEEPEDDLEEELKRVEAAPRHEQEMQEDLEVEEVWEDLMLWCSTHGESVDYNAHASLGRGLDVWRVEGCCPVLLPHAGKLGALNEGDVYLVLNRVDDRTGAIGHVNDAYHDRKSRVKTLWTMHFWIGGAAHPLKAGVAAALAVELCKVLKRHARPIREVQGKETDMFKSLFPNHTPTYAEGGCDHGFRTPPERVHVDRLIRVEVPPGQQDIACREVLLSADSLHGEACFILDTLHRVYVYTGARSSKRELARASQIASLIGFRERTRGGAGSEIVFANEGRSEHGHFWETLSGSPQEVPETREACSSIIGWDEPILYRLDDLQEQLEVTHVAKGTLLREVGALDGTCCYVVRACDRVYLWKGGGSTLDARTYGLKFAYDLASEMGVGVGVLPQHTEDVMFLSHFAHVSWVVYADPPTARVAAGMERTIEINVRKMHSVTVRSWLHTGDAVRKHNHSLAVLQQGELIGLRAWSIENFSLVPVTQDVVGQFSSDKSYLVQCTYQSNGLDRHMIYFWQGWACSKVESLVWQYDVQELMAKRLEKLTGAKPLQVTVRQGKEPGHFLQLFNGSATFHAPTAAPLYGLHASETAAPKGVLYALSGSGASRAYAIQVPFSVESLQSNSSFFVSGGEDGGGYLWHGYWTDIAAREVACHAAACLSPKAEGLVTVHERSEPEDFWEALGAPGGGRVCTGFDRDAPWWTPRLFGCKAVSCQLRVREVFDFVQPDLRYHKAMLLDDYSRVYLWLGPQSNAVVQRLALDLARSYIANAPDGRDRGGEVTLVHFGKEPRAMKALFPWWIDWPPGTGDLSRRWGVRDERNADRFVHEMPSHNMAIPWLSPSVLRQGKGLLKHSGETRERNPLDKIVWRSHERAKWLSWTKSGTSPFRNTFFKRKGASRI